MATRQYIGARYVIKIYENSTDTSSAEWESSVNYEPLTMVTYNNGSYLSKKEVPASVGNPASNPTYWVQTGFYNGQIANLQQQIDDINNNKLPDITSDIGDLSDDVTEIRNELDNLKTPLEKSILLIGNSYIGKGVCNILLEQFDHSYSKVSDGAGFVTYTGHTTTFEDLLDDAVSDTSFDNDTITDVLFVSAAGDPRAFDEGESAYNNALKATLDSINTKISDNFPNCHRSMITFAEVRDIAVTGDTKYSTLFAIHRAFKKYASICNIEYLGWCGFDSMFNVDNVMTDHLHPTDQGAARIGAWLRNSYNGHAEYHKFTARNTSMNFKYTDSAHAVALVELTPDEWSFEIRTVTATSGENVTITANAALLDFNEFTGITIPGPSYYDTTQAASIKSRGGDDIDYLILSIGNDSNGVCLVKPEFSPTAASINTGTLTCPELNNVILM